MVYLQPVFFWLVVPCLKFPCLAVWALLLIGSEEMWMYLSAQGVDIPEFGPGTGFDAQPLVLSCSFSPGAALPSQHLLLQKADSRAVPRTKEGSEDE